MDEKTLSELEVILSELQLLNIRLANVIEYYRQQMYEKIVQGEKISLGQRIEEK